MRGLRPLVVDPERLIGQAVCVREDPAGSEREGIAARLGIDQRRVLSTVVVNNLLIGLSFKSGSGSRRVGYGRLFNLGPARRRRKGGGE